MKPRLHVLVPSYARNAANNTHPPIPPPCSYPSPFPSNQEKPTKPNHEPSSIPSPDIQMPQRRSAPILTLPTSSISDSQAAPAIEALRYFDW